MNFHTKAELLVLRFRCSVALTSFHSSFSLVNSEINICCWVGGLPRVHLSTKA